MKKRDRITSFLLVFILTIQLIPAQALAFSTNFATSFTDYGPYEFSIPSEEESQYQNSTDRYYDLVYTPEGDRVLISQKLILEITHIILS